MSYCNPLLAYGLEKLAERCEECHVGGLIVPDLPWEESDRVRELFQDRGVGLVQMVTPATPRGADADLVRGAAAGSSMP